MSSAVVLSNPVFLTLVTTEPQGEGKLIRIAAESADGSRKLERLISVPRLSLSQTRFTGVTNSQLDDAAELDYVLQELIDFSENSGAWVAANGDVARRALREAARESGFPGSFGPELIGIDELSGVVLPTVGRRGLRDVQQHYGCAAQSAASGIATAAPSPAELREVYFRLETDLLKLPLPVLAEMNWLLAKSSHPLKAVVKKAEGEAVKNQFSETFNSGKVSLDKLFRDFSKIIERLAPDENAEEGASIDDPREPVKPEEIAELLGPTGKLAAGLQGYEERTEQVEMAQHVGTALSDGKHLLVEAGTGIGKSLAYLIPAILFAKRAARPVMISTHTKNLQSQLFDKDLPFLRDNLGIEFDAALLKGRPNYLCLRKFMYTIQEASSELDDEERADILPVMTWATQTETGDVSELAAFSREQNPELWDRLHTVGDDCLKRQCPFYNRCFVYKARGLARSADVVVLNHALVFAELNLEAGTLPAYSEIVFDEAHKLEDVATEHLACEVTPRRSFQILSRLFRAPQGGAGKGLLTSLLHHLDLARSEFQEPLYEAIREHILVTMQAVEPAANGTEAFFNVVREWTDQPPPADEAEPAQPFVPMERGRTPIQSGGSSPLPFPFKKKAQRSFADDRKRYSAQTLRPHEVKDLESGKEAAISTLGRLRQALDVLEEDFKEIRKRQVGRARELTTEISAQNLFIRELIHDIEFVIKGDEPNYVYWSEKLGRRYARVIAAPLDIAKLLYDQLYEKKRSIIFSSATLSVRDPDAGPGSGFAPVRSFGARPFSARSEDDNAPTAPIVSGEKPHKKAFEFVKNRLGLSLIEPERLDELLLGSPFSYEKNCRLYVPTFLPEPSGREKDYNSAFTAMVAELALITGGRAMVLYTSYAALESSAAILRKALAPEGIDVLAQGTDGSRESLLARLKAGERTVLLGTASFWEGVDVRGEALSLLIIAKLPFAVFTDPIVEGRCELLEAEGKDPFLHFSIPQAILKLRQGFGRLIRSKTDRGVVVLADKRVITKRYGAAFLRALPARATTMTNQEALSRVVKEFIG